MIMKLFGVRVRTWGFHPHKKIVQGDWSLRGTGIFLPKIRNFRDFELLKKIYTC